MFNLVTYNFFSLTNSVSQFVIVANHIKIANLSNTVFICTNNSPGHVSLAQWLVVGEVVSFY